MHPNPTYRQVTREENLQFARDQGFGILAVAGTGIPQISHIPFVISDRGDRLWFHLVRSNPIAQELRQNQIVKLVINGPHSYVSPDWYEIEDQVPTWNYVAVHLTGTARPLGHEQLHGVLEHLSDHFESRLQPKPIWRTEKIGDGVMDRMMRQILPFEMDIEQIDGTWKLGQNKPAASIQNAAEHMDANGIGQEVRLLAALMRGSTEPRS